MHRLTELIKADMRPALGVTEPGAIAFAVATARGYLNGPVERILLNLNSGMYKNAFTCGIPNSQHFGSQYAAALGAIAGRPDQGLECLAEVTESDDRLAERWIGEGRVTVRLTQMSSDIFIRAIVESASDQASVTIQDAHTHITEIKHNEEILFEQPRLKRDHGGQESAEIHQYSLEQILEYCRTVPAQEIRFVEAAFKMNMDLFYLGLNSPKTRFVKYLCEENGGKVFSADELKTASLLCNGAIEARVLGLNKPAMSITGSGAHGIIATLPLYAAAKCRGLEPDLLYRAAMLSYLVCTYIKEYSGKLSAFCGCAIAGGTGMALGLVYLYGGKLKELEHCLNGMGGSITGMVCDGGNQGCIMKGVVAVNTAFQSARMAMKNTYLDPIHGINGQTPEATMRHMGMIASPGMAETERIIVEIMGEG